MDLTFNRMERIVGTFVIGIAVLLLSTVIVVGRGKNWFEKSITYYTTFNEGYNLQINTPVKLFKADIGKVKQITLAENKVKVKLSILQKYQSRIRANSVAVVESPTFIGSEYVSIIPGKSWANPIPAEGEIPSRERKSISDILAEFQVEKAGRMIVEAIENITNITEDLNDRNGPLYTTLNNLEQISSHVENVTSGIQKGDGTVGSLVSTRELMDGVMARLDQVELILKDVSTATAKTPHAMDQVNSGLSNLNTATENVGDVVAQVTSVVADIKKAAGTLQVILENVKAGSRDVPQVASTAKEGIAEIRKGVANIDKVVQSLQKNILIRGNLPQDPELGETTTGLRQ